MDSTATTPLSFPHSLHASIKMKATLNLQDLEDQALCTPQYRLEAAIVLLRAIKNGRKKEGPPRPSIPNDGDWRRNDQARSRTRDLAPCKVQTQSSQTNTVVFQDNSTPAQRCESRGIRTTPAKTRVKGHLHNLPSDDFQRHLPRTRTRSFPATYYSCTRKTPSIQLPSLRRGNGQNGPSP